MRFARWREDQTLAHMAYSYNAPMLRRPALLSTDPDAPFPPVESALREPDGLLAVGGDLSPPRLLNAYRYGIFPWYSEGQPFLWWSPDPRMVFRTDAVHLASRLRRKVRHSSWQIHADHAFSDVITACAQQPRPGQDGTWITTAMQEAYLELHRLGHAHSIEVHDGTTLVGGLYGIAIGRMFFAESMVSIHTGGSKVALAALAARLQAWQWPLIDAQVENAHLRSLGAESWPRADFARQIAGLVELAEPVGHWRNRFGTLDASQLAI